MHDSSQDMPEKSVGKNGAFCVWLMGLSASGKTTLARMLAHALAQRGFTVEVLDGDIVRTTLSKGLGFTRGDREANLRHIASLARASVSQHVVPVVAAICPYHAIRQEMRATIGEFVEVYLNCPLEVCIRRDPKGLYRKALAREIQNFTGIDDAFEVPVQPDIEVRTHIEDPEASLARILRGLEALSRITPETGDPQEADDRDQPQPHRALRVAR